MPQVLQKTLLDAVTVDGSGPAKDVRNTTSMSAFVSAVGGTSVTVKFQGTTDPTGSAGWTDIAFRQPGGGAYATTGVSVTPAAPKCIFFDPADNVCWIRAVTSATTGTTTTALLTGEV